MHIGATLACELTKMTHVQCTLYTAPCKVCWRFRQILTIADYYITLFRCMENLSETIIASLILFWMDETCSSQSLSSKAPNRESQLGKGSKTPGTTTFRWGGTRNCHQKLLSEIVIRNCHKKLSSEIVIRNCHRKLSS